MSWLLAALKVAEMHSPQPCSQCGSATVLSDGRCAMCGLPRGDSPLLEDAPDQAANPARAQLVPAATALGAFSRACAACGAPLADTAYWCGKCGQSRISLAVTPLAPAAESRRVKPTLAPVRWSASAFAGIGAFAAVCILVFGAIAGGFWMTGYTGVSGRSPTPMPIGAAGGSSEAGTQTQTSDGAASAGSDGAAGSSIATGPLSSGANAAATGSSGLSAAAGADASASAASSSASSSSDSGVLTVVITSLPSSIGANSQATLAALTSPGAACQAKVKYHSGKLSTHSAFNKKQTADPAGMVSWTWTVDPGTELGTGTATVTCKLKSQSASKDRVFVVV